MNAAKSRHTDYFNEAENLRKNGKFEKSITLLEELLQTSKKHGDKEKECEILSKLGLLYWNIGNLDQSSNYYKQALYTAEKIGSRSKYEKAQAAINIYYHYIDGKKHRSAGKNQESIKSFQVAIDLARKIRSKEHKVKCLRQLSLTYWNLNNLSKFFSLNEEALKIAEELNHEKEKARSLNNIGLYHEINDNYSKALIYYQRALGIINELNSSKLEESELLNNIAIIYFNL